jgi:hypothetical protein
MPRYARLHAPGALVHVISRFVNRDFRMAGAVERSEYLRRAADVLMRTDWLPIAYVLMSSHLHWLALAGLLPSASFIQPLHTGYARWLNQHQNALGPVFSERHTTILCDPTHAARVIAYVHNNPVRAGVVVDPVDTDWSSHRAYLGLAEPPRWLDVSRGLELAGYDESAAGRIAFHESVLSQRGTTREELFGESQLAATRAEVRAKLGVPVETTQPVLTATGSLQVEVVSRGPLARVPAWGGSPLSVIDAVAAHFGVSARAIQSTSRCRNLTQARRAALAVWREYLGRPQVTMAEALGVSNSGASRLLTSQRGGNDDVARSSRLIAEFFNGDQGKTQKLNTVPIWGGVRRG